MLSFFKIRFLKTHLFQLFGSIIFKKNCPKRTRFCKIGLGNTLFIFWQKNVVCFVCSNSLSDFGLLFFNCSSSRAEISMLSCTQIAHHGSFSNCGDFEIPILINSADLQRCNWASRQSEVRFRQTFFSKWSKKVLYKMVLVSDNLDHIGRIYSPLNLENIKTKICQEYRTG